jgi:Cof subfamily protein (haloacid dehalogenase superfamily)
MPMRRVASFADACRIIEEHGTRLLKGLFIGEPHDNDVLVARLRARFDGRLSVVRSHNLFAEVISLDASKGHALAFLARKYGVAQSETMAVGDSGNDVSMIRWASVGVAMDNATSDVKAAADWVAPSVTEDGLVAVIEKYVLRNGRI